MKKKILKHIWVADKRIVFTTKLYQSKYKNPLKLIKLLVTFGNASCENNHVQCL